MAGIKIINKMQIVKLMKHWQRFVHLTPLVMKTMSLM